MHAEPKQRREGEERERVTTPQDPFLLALRMIFHCGCGSQSPCGEIIVMMPN